MSKRALPHQPSKEQMLEHLQQQKQAFIKERPVSLAVRRDRLQRALNMFIEHADNIAAAQTKDFGGRHEAVSLALDVHGPVSVFKYYRKNMKKWVGRQKRGSAIPFNLFGGRTEVRYQPKGIVGIAGTWNAPLFTLFAPWAAATAAGNRAMMKPSDLSPHVSEWLASTVPDYFDPLELSIATGEVETAVAFTALPFDHLAFTGSGATARHVMRAAAENLVPLTLELGGKSPTVISRQVKLEKAVDSIVSGKTQNNGQICVSPDTLYVPKNMLEDFIRLFRQSYESYYGSQVSGNQDLTSVINERHLMRVEGYISEAREKGVRVEVIGGDAPVDAGNRKRPMRLVIDPAVDLQISCEEIFGPAIVVRTYESIEAVVDAINGGDNPLALYYFGTDKAEREYVIEHTLAGGTVVNDVLLHAAMNDAPFGGVGASGMGRYNGPEGFLEFSHHRTVYHAGWWDPRKKMGLLPPFDSGKAAKAIKDGLKAPF